MNKIILLITMLLLLTTLVLANQAPVIEEIDVYIDDELIEPNEPSIEFIDVFYLIYRFVPEKIYYKGG